MSKPLRTLLVALLVTLFVAAPTSLLGAEDMHHAEDVSAVTMLFDLVFLRPVGIVGTGLGAATYVVTLPFSGLGGNADDALEKLVKEPFRYAFKRPIGKI